MKNVLGKIEKWTHLPRDNDHYSLIHFHFSFELAL